MNIETLSNQEDLVASELKEMFGGELNVLHQKIEKQGNVEKQTGLVHYSKLTPEELNQVENSKKNKMDMFQDELRSLSVNSIDNILDYYFTPNATVSYYGKGRSLRNMKVKDFLFAVANGQIDISGIDGSNLIGKSERMRSSLLKPTVVHLSDNDITTYTPLMSSIEIYNLSEERLRDIPNLNSDRWDSGSNEMLTK